MIFFAIFLRKEEIKETLENCRKYDVLKKYIHKYILNDLTE